MPRVLLLLPTTTYRTEAFVSAATRLGVDVTVASEQPNTLTRLNPAGLLTLDFNDPRNAAQRVVEFSASHPIDAALDRTLPTSAWSERRSAGTPSWSVAACGATG
jgi:hypothetical protein